MPIGELRTVSTENLVKKMLFLLIFVSLQFGWDALSKCVIQLTVGWNTQKEHTNLLGSYKHSQWQCIGGCVDYRVIFIYRCKSAWLEKNTWQKSTIHQFTSNRLDFLSVVNSKIVKKNVSVTCIWPVFFYAQTIELFAIKYTISWYILKCWKQRYTCLFL